MYRLRIRLRRDFYFRRLSEQHPRAHIQVWCNFTHDIVEAQTGDADAAAGLRRDLARMVGVRIRPLHISAHATQAFTFACQSHGLRRGITAIIESHGGLVMPPLVYEDGWEYVTILLVDESQDARMLQALSAKGPLEILSKRRLKSPLISQTLLVQVEELLASLTRRQAKALLDAHARGYYDVPRKANAQDVARALGEARTTYEEHLRKAERKIIDGVVPYLRMILAQRPQTYEAIPRADVPKLAANGAASAVTLVTRS